MAACTDTTGQKRNTAPSLLFLIILLYFLFPFSLHADNTTLSPSGIPPLLTAQVDLDYVYDDDLDQQQRNLDLLINRICSLGVTTVALQTFADPDGNGVAEALYFPNRFLPVRRDLFFTTARALQGCGISVFAWIPLLAFSPENSGELSIVSRHPFQQNASVSYPRLSPFNPAARQIIMGIYEDLARSGSFEGILFHDDGYLSDYEDASPAAAAVYQKNGFPEKILSIHKDRKLMHQWSRFKTKYLIDFSLTLLDIVRRYHSDIRSARNMYALPILQPDSEHWLAQSLSLFLQAYDYTFIMAMPYMEKVTDSVSWFINLAEQSLFQAVTPASVVMELQTVDWQRNRQIPVTELSFQMILLQKQGIISFAYYPDDFHKNFPDPDSLKHSFSRLKRSWIIQKND